MMVVSWIGHLPSNDGQSTSTGTSNSMYLEDLVEYVQSMQEHSHTTSSKSERDENCNTREGGGGEVTASGGHQHEKDSGVGRTDESNKNEESSEHDISDTDCVMQQLSPSSGVSSSSSSATPRGVEQPGGTPQVPCSEVAALQERCHSVSSIDREIAALNKEMEHIQVECQQLVEKHFRKVGEQLSPQSLQLRSHHQNNNHIAPTSTTAKHPQTMKQEQCEQHSFQQQELQQPLWCPQVEPPKLQPDVVHEKPQLPPRPNLLQQTVAGKQTRTVSAQPMDLHNTSSSSSSSAYNTGDSCRGTPVIFELTPSTLLADRKEACAENTNATHGSMMSLVERPGKGSKSSRRESGVSSKQKKEEQSFDVMYTNSENLQHTISLQQEMFRKGLLKKQHKPEVMSSQETAHAHRSPSSRARKYSEQNGNISAFHSGFSSQTEDMCMEWKVKRRADGTRYICRRPVRNKIIREKRAHELQEERSGLTTDDDMMSELKLGRYWTKEERKQQLEKARDQKRRKEFMMQRRMEVLQEGQEGVYATGVNGNLVPGGEKKNIDIVELSNKKMMKRKGKKMLDDFVTVEELMAHGNKSVFQNTSSITRHQTHQPLQQHQTPQAPPQPQPQPQQQNIQYGTLGKATPILSVTTV